MEIGGPAYVGGDEEGRKLFHNVEGVSAYLGSIMWFETMGIRARY